MGHCKSVRHSGSIGACPGGWVMKQETTMRLIWGGLSVVALALLGGFGAGVDTAPAERARR